MYKFIAKPGKYLTFISQTDRPCPVKFKENYS